jgi:LPS-assembly protein
MLNPDNTDWPYSSALRPERHLRLEQPLGHCLDTDRRTMNSTRAPQLSRLEKGPADALRLGRFGLTFTISLFMPWVFAQSLDCGPVLPPLEDPNANASITAIDAMIAPGRGAEFNGDVVIRQNDRSFKARSARIDYETDTLYLEEGVLIQDSDLCIEGRRAEGRLLSGEGLIESAKFLQSSGLRGDVEGLQLYRDGALSLSSGTITFCPSPKPPWSLEIQSLETSPDQTTLTARQTTLRIKGLPALYIPYVKVPVGDKRQSGLLPADITNDSRDGITAELQYYLNLHPQRDATLGLRTMTDRGTLWLGEMRNLSEHHQESFYGEYIGHDQIYERAGLDDKRWFTGVHHLGTWSSIQTQIDYTKASSREHLRDFMSPLKLGGEYLGLTRQTNPLDTRLLSALPQYAGITFFNQGFRGGLEVQRYQGLLSQVLETFERQPSLFLSHSGKGAGWQFSSDLQWTEFKRTATDRTEETIGRQLLRFEVARNWAPHFGYTNTRLGVTHLRYKKDSLSAPQQAVSDSIPHLVLESGLFFDRGGAVDSRSTLMPRVLLAYSGESEGRQFSLDSAPLEPDINNLFDTSGFSGLDPIESGFRGSLGLKSAHYAHDGRAWLSMEVGQRYFDVDAFSDESNSRESSPLYLSVEWQPRSRWQAGAQVEWRAGASSPINQYFDLSLLWGERGRFTLQHVNRARAYGSWAGTRAERVMLSQIATRVPIARDWSLIGMWSRNHELNRQVERIAGLEMDGCCVRLSFAYRRFSDPKLGLDESAKSFYFIEESRSGVFLEVELKGLSSFGNGIGKVLSRSFPAF